VLQLPQQAAPETRLVALPGRGVTRVWECAGPPGAPVLMLIHGVTVTAELNWGQVFAPLSRHFRVLAMDLRGHGDGIPAGFRFRLEDCADDVAALAEALAIDGFVAVGYSMGGMVAQLVARRHAPVVSGLVLCATARSFPRRNFPVRVPGCSCAEGARKDQSSSGSFCSCSRAFMVARDPGRTQSGRSGLSITRTPGFTSNPPAPPTHKTRLMPAFFMASMIDAVPRT
jgi:pimeloyl-ACP methyl ester carboxylesterase